jgi:hypothetical protein
MLKCLSTSTFHVVQSAGSDSYNFVNTVVRDVVSIGTSKSDLITIRFFADHSTHPLRVVPPQQCSGSC